MSLVVHLSFVLLLALLAVVSNSGIGSGGVLIEANVSGEQGDGDDALMAAGVELPSELSSGTEALDSAEPEMADLTTAADLSGSLAIANPLAGDAGSLSGIVGGTGDQQGPLGAAHGTGPPGATGRPVSTGLFGLRGEGADFVYVFDRSDSMNSVFSYASEGKTVFSITPLDAAKAELLKSLGDLKEDNRFHILFYNHDTWLFDTGKEQHKELVLATPDMKRLATQFVSTVYGNGRTKHVPALETAIKMRPEVIFLLTDGEEKDDPSPAELAKLRRLNGGRTKINVVQFCYEMRSGGSLVQLAQESGGKHIYFNISKLAPNINELTGADQTDTAQSGAAPAPAAVP